jgi:hypothetical protein
MAVSLRHEQDNVYRIEISGMLQERDFVAAQRSLAAELEGGGRGRVRLLVVLAQFEGWESAAWSDLAFYVGHGDDIERIAIVGDDRWRDEALMFAATDLRKAPVAYFGAIDATQARAWLSS